jgi:hypothetical protein
MPAIAGPGPFSPICLSIQPSNRPHVQTDRRACPPVHLLIRPTIYPSLYSSDHALTRLPVPGLLSVGGRICQGGTGQAVQGNE